MRNALRTRLSMLQSVVKLFDTHPDLWNKKEAIVEGLVPIREGVADLQEASEDQSAGNPTGLTQDKRAARDRAEALLAHLGEAAGAHAFVAGDNDFRVATVISLSEWDHKADADFFADAETALTAIENAQDALARYEVTPEEVAEARTAVEAARPIGAVRNVRRAGRVRATAALDGGYSAVIPHLLHLDRLVRRLVRDETFVADYFIARRITDG